MNNKQTTAMQELVRQINGAIQIIDEHGKLNDYAQCRKEVYQSVLDVATELLTKEREDKKRLEEMICNTEKQRKEWADMCIRKQEKIEFLESEVQRLLSDNIRLMEADSFKEGNGDIA